MAAPMEKTSTPGIYKRGSKFVVVFYAEGKQHKEAVGTLSAARKLKAKRVTQVHDGEFHARSRVRFLDYADAWVERHHGRGTTTFREETRSEYRALLQRYAHGYFKSATALTQVQPVHIAEWVAWLCDEVEQGRRLSDKTIRNIVSPVRRCLSAAVEEGLIRSNPALGIGMPNRPVVVEDDDDEDGDVKVFTREQLAFVLEATATGRYAVLYQLLAGTGLRISEAIGLQWRHVDLEAAKPSVKVRRRIVRGRVGPPKSRHSRREVPITLELARGLREHRDSVECSGAQDLVFRALNGSPLNIGNVRRRSLKPIVRAAGADFAGFHTFRHTYASMAFEDGRNAVQVQKLMGHHSAAFTLSRYVHLLNDDVGPAVPVPMPSGGNEVAMDGASMSGNVQAGTAA